ncbi:hypothetical protein BDY24DRAFT_22851 [Mrakia frigida]|uniref:ADP-ribosylation factor GTPase-activating protein n=1 Tax=Mrakia frigida TaxID=29902 RepID=UPI003FCC171A
MAAKARNERVIEDLLKIPGNEICADCRGSGPRWCSWNIGILLCVPCASQHRRLGTHISKVKSLTLDVFTREQIESIRSMGNIKSNALINNDDRTNPPPTSWEDSARESELERSVLLSTSVSIST